MSADVSKMQDASFSPVETGIRIYEILDSSETNPKPEHELEVSLGEFVSPQKLKEITGCSNLFDLMELKLKVDTNETSIGNIGSMIPNLKSLNLSNSYITSIRDLGTNFNNLSLIWLCRCSLSELDGISSLSSLRELFLAFNEIADLSPLSMLDTLEVLDLEANNVDDITQVEFLSLCNQLTNLTMKGNPIEIAPTSYSKQSDLKFYCYQEAILSCLPSLKVLDDEHLLVEKVNGIEVKRVNPTKVNKRALPFENDLKIIEESLKCLEVEENEDVVLESNTARPLSAQKRLGSAKSPSTSNQDTEDTEKSTAWKKDAKDASQEPLTNASSDLTTGEIMCGNPVAALRQRKRLKKPTETTTIDKALPPKAVKCKSSTSFKPEHSYFTSEEVGSESKEDIFEELRQWRLNNKILFDNNNNTAKQQPQPLCTKPSSATEGTATKDAPRASFSPTPPSMPRKNKTPTRVRRSLPSPPTSPSTEDNRPHTVAEFRTERERSDVNHSLELRDETIKEGEESNFYRTDLNAVNQDNLSHPPINRPSTARAALQSLQKPYTRP